jgi:hypothetical protein
VAGVDEFEIGLGDGVEENVFAGVPGFGWREVLRVTAEASRDVVEQRAGGGGAEGEIRATEAVEGLDAEMVAEEVGGLGEIESESVVRCRGDREVEGRGIFAVGHEDFAGGKAGELVGKLRGGGDFRETEFAGAEVEPGEAVGLFSGEDGGEVVVAVFLESEIVEGAGAEDAGDFAADEFARGDVADLVADGDAFTGFNEFRDVGAGAVVGDAAHGDVAAFGQGDIEEGRRFAGVVEKHFVKVAKAEEEKGVGGKLAADVLVLADHGGELRGGHGMGFIGPESGKRKAELGVTFGRRGDRRYRMERSPLRIIAGGTRPA